MRIARDEMLASNWRAIGEQLGVLTLRNSACSGEFLKELDLTEGRQ